jgi:diguanylate cyclase (GGDEF)-like protein
MFAHRATTEALALGALFLAVHALAIAGFPSHAMAGSYLVALGAPIIPLMACFGIARAVGRGAGWKWMALCAGLALWDGGLAAAAWDDLFDHDNSYVSAAGGFVYFTYGVPLLLAIGASRNDRHIPAVLWIDGILAAAIGILAFRGIFLSVSSAGSSNELTAATRVAYTYDAENVLLASLAGIRLLAADSQDERAFYRVLVMYLSVYAISAALYNHLVALRWQMPMGSPWDLLLDAPFLLLAVCARSPEARDTAPQRRRVPRSTTRMIQAGISVSLPLVLLVCGLMAVESSPIIAVIGIIGSLAGYGLRNVLSQARLMESEEALLKSHQALKQAALSDPLTGVGNRRSFDQTLEREWLRAARTSEPIALLIIDVDHFKKINDIYGHQRGDELLMRIARGLEGALPRVTDALARYGGEEFACVLSATDADGAMNVAERLRSSVEALQLAHAGSPCGIVTMSCGVTACGHPTQATASMLMRAADRALYEAKRNGRNRVEFVPTEGSLHRAKEDRSASVA